MVTCDICGGDKAFAFKREGERVIKMCSRCFRKMYKEIE